MSEYHFAKGNLIFITWFQQMKWLQMCYVQAVGANKIHFLEGMKAHISHHVSLPVLEHEEHIRAREEKKGQL